jgi:hypothetical protein
MERENRALRRTNKLLESASAFIDQAALDRELKK